MHVIDILENLGRVPDVRLNDVHLIDILIAKAYRSLTEEEIEFINKFQISFNSKKNCNIISKPLFEIVRNDIG